jgi:hypothetical protein
VLKLKKPDASWAEARLASGIIEVKKHKTVIITELAEWIPETKE